MPVALLVNVCDCALLCNSIASAKQYLSFIRECHLHKFVAESEKNRMFGAQPLLDIGDEVVSLPRGHRRQELPVLVRTAVLLLLFFQ